MLVLLLERLKVFNPLVKFLINPLNFILSSSLLPLMSIITRFNSNDLFKFNNVNLDYWTETYSIKFYQNYLITNPKLNFKLTLSDDTLLGYLISKVEGRNYDFHSHVTALSICHQFRKIGSANKLMNVLEYLSNEYFRTYFIDLFVRPSNSNALKMYHSLSYSVYRTVVGYYGDDEDAYGRYFICYVFLYLISLIDMRKCTKHDVDKKTVRENGRLFKCSPQDTIFA